MTDAQKLAAFTAGVTDDRLSNSARQQLKIRVLDALGCAVGALDSPVISQLRAHTEELGKGGDCTLIGGARFAPDRAAFFNSALVRYLDFNDSYLAPGETCHSSDNLGAVLAACEYANRSGHDFLTALAIAYQVQCRLSDWRRCGPADSITPPRALMPWRPALPGPWVSMLPERRTH